MKKSTIFLLYSFLFTGQCTAMFKAAARYDAEQRAIRAAHAAITKREAERVERRKLKEELLRINPHKIAQGIGDHSQLPKELSELAQQYLTGKTLQQHADDQEKKRITFLQAYDPNNERHETWINLFSNHSNQVDIRFVGLNLGNTSIIITPWNTLEDILHSAEELSGLPAGTLYIADKAIRNTPIAQIFRVKTLSELLNKNKTQGLDVHQTRCGTR